MKDVLSTLDGLTPLDPDEAAGLIAPAVATRRDLNLLEQANIAEARRWVLERKHPDLLTDAFVRESHRRMFKDVWRWAGKYRTTMKNLGVLPESISVSVRDLCSDATHWVENRTYPLDAAAARLHHRLVSIHPFANGNGRHARLMADAFLVDRGQEEGTWGSLKAERDGETTRILRDRYLGALRAADKCEMGPLIVFLRS